MKRVLAWFIAVVLYTGSAACAGQVPTMDKEELKNLLGSDNLVVLDVRQDRDWSPSEFKIKDAVRVENGDLSVANNYPKDHTFVLYCAWSNEATSASLAQKLIDKGYGKVYALKGGWREWFQAKYPVAEK